MITPSDYSRIRSLALAAAPELQAKPLYIIEPPADYPPLPHSMGFTTLTVDWLIRAALISHGEWYGPGTMIVVNGGEDYESLAGLVLHETAHNLPFAPSPPDREPTAAEASRQAELVALWAGEPTSQLFEPWHQHDDQFIRRCIHLRHRAALVGTDLPLPAIHFAGAHYGVSGAWKYQRAIGDEPARMVDATFAEIHDTKVPTEFAELWAADVAAWHRTESVRNKQE